MNVLVVGAHPDDELLGVGGTLLRHVRNGDRVSALILTDGHLARLPGRRPPREDPPEVIARRRSAERAAELLGLNRLELLSFPDQRLDTIPLVEVVREIERMVGELAPEIVYTHHRGDVNHDHRIAFEATLTATRTAPGRYPRRVLCYETVSSTEWGAPFPESAFVPNVYVDISEHLEDKLRILREYRQEMRPPPHPRSYEGLRVSARRWGSVVGVEAAEAFVLVREVW